MLKANELWLTQIHNSLNEGGVWIWKDKVMLFKKDGEKLLCDGESYQAISKIVRKEFLTKTFKKY